MAGRSMLEARRMGWRWAVQSNGVDADPTTSGRVGNQCRAFKRCMLQPIVARSGGTIN